MTKHIYNLFKMTAIHVKDFRINGPVAGGLPSQKAADVTLERFLLLLACTSRWSHNRAMVLWNTVTTVSRHSNV